MSHNHNKINQGRFIQILWQCKWPPTVSHWKRIMCHPAAASTAKMVGRLHQTAELEVVMLQDLWCRGELITTLPITEQAWQNCTCQGCNSDTLLPLLWLMNLGAQIVNKTADMVHLLLLSFQFELLSVEFQCIHRVCNTSKWTSWKKKIFAFI